MTAVTAPSPVADALRRYLHDRSEAERGLCMSEDGRVSLKPAVAHFGCPFCGTQEHASYQTPLGPPAAAYGYVRCLECELVYPWPRLSREALAERVNAPWLNRYLARAFEGMSHGVKGAPFPGRVFQRLAGAAVVEVGPGAGQLLEYLRRIGARAVGVEPNSVAAASCRQRGVDVIQAMFDEDLLASGRLDPGRFDAVVFLESIYHLFDLREALALAHRLLRSKGELIIRAFDIESLPVRHFRWASAGIDGLSIPVNGSARTYARLVARSGFRVVRVYRCPGSVLDHLGVVQAPTSGAAGLALKVLDRAFDVALRVLGRSRNFVLLAEKQ